MTKPNEYLYHGDHITLGQFLKASNLVQTGGEGKVMLTSGAIMVNGEQELRRGRKLRQGDLVQFGRQLWLLVSAPL